MLNDDFYEKFASEWIEAWNSHDIESILSHYEEDFEFSSPILAKLNPASGGRLTGKEGARAYWSKALTILPDLYFEPVTLLKGVGSMVIYYKGVGGKLCAEFFVFGTSGKVSSSHAHGAIDADRKDIDADGADK
jgi:SnoaL-like domain